MLEKQPVLVRKKEKVLVEQRTDGSVCVFLRGKYLNYTVLPKRPKKVVEAKVPALTSSKSPWKPPANHPWRKPFLIGKNKVKHFVQRSEI